MLQVKVRVGDWGFIVLWCTAVSKTFENETNFGFHKVCCFCALDLVVRCFCGLLMYDYKHLISINDFIDKYIKFI